MNVALSALCLMSGTAPGRAHLELRRLWSVPTDLGITAVLDAKGDEALTNKGVVSMRDGSLSPRSLAAGERQRVDRVRERRLPPYDSKAPVKSVVLWDEPGRKVGYRPAADPRMGLFEVVDYVPGTDAIRGAFPLPSGYSLAESNAEGSLLVFGSRSFLDDHYSAVDRLRLRGGAPSPLPFHRVYDITRPVQGVLGVPLPEGGMERVSLMREAPDSPLACGDPFSGRVRWSNPRYNLGAWIGRRWVLAAETRNRRYAILDSGTGKEVEADITDFGDVRFIFRIAASGDVLVGSFIDGAGKISTDCYRLVLMPR